MSTFRELKGVRSLAEAKRQLDRKNGETEVVVATYKDRPVEGGGWQTPSTEESFRLWTSGGNKVYARKP